MTKDIGGVFVRKNESVLNDIGKQLNTIVFDTSLNSKNYGDSSDELQLIYQSASEALRCHVEYFTIEGKFSLMTLEYVHRHRFPLFFFYMTRPVFSKSAGVPFLHLPVAQEYCWSLRNHGWVTLLWMRQHKTH